MDTKVQVTQAAPPVAVSGLTLAGLSLQQWVYALTIIYLLMQMSWFVYKRIKGIDSET